MCNCFYSDLWYFLSEASIVLAPIASFIIALVALRLSRKVSFKKKVKEKQFELINHLINEISKQQITFYYYVDGEGHHSSTMFLPHLLAQNFREVNPTMFTNRRFLVEHNSVEQFFGFLQYRGNPYMPKTLFELMDKFWFRHRNEFNISQLSNNELALMNGLSTPNSKFYFSTRFDTFEDFFEFIVSFIKEINSWLKKHGAGEIAFRTDSQIN